VADAIPATEGVSPVQKLERLASGIKLRDGFPSLTTADAKVLLAALRPTQPPTAGRPVKASNKSGAEYMWELAHYTGAHVPKYQFAPSRELTDILELLADAQDALRAKSPEPCANYDVLAGFADWLCREMPAGTVIGDPRWWAPRLLRAVEVFQKSRGPELDANGYALTKGTQHG
jgi:hypothetical protein